MFAVDGFFEVLELSGTNYVLCSTSIIANKVCKFGFAIYLDLPPGCQFSKMGYRVCQRMGCQPSRSIRKYQALSGFAINCQQLCGY